MGKVKAQPSMILLAIEYIGKNEPCTKDDLFKFLLDYVDQEKQKQKEEKQKLDGHKNRNLFPGKTENVLTNIKDYLQFVEKRDNGFWLTVVASLQYPYLYSGRQVFERIQADDRLGAFRMISHNTLFMIPEMRAIVVFINKRKGLKKLDIEHEFHGKSFFGSPTFNSATVNFEITRAKELGIIVPIDQTYSLKEMNIPLFTQILIEEYVQLLKNYNDNTVPLKELKDILNLKYNIPLKDFDQFFSSIMTSIPGLIIPGAYSKISINLDVGKGLKLYE